MTAMYHEHDGNPAALNDCHIAVLGYGNLGRPLALNLRDSGLKLIIGNQDDQYAEQARQDGFEVAGLAQASRAADIKLLMLPDEALPELYISDISPSLRPDDTLVFA